MEKEIVSTQATKKKLDQLIELQTIKNKRLKGEKLTEEEIARALNLLCWNSFAGCCAPWRDCVWNSAVCDALGIDYKEVYETKREAVEKHLKKLGINV